MSLHQDPLAGTRYRTIRQLGQGGMGLVVEAERVGLGRRYAVKLLLAEGLTEPSAIERFRREAQVLAKLSSPHLTAVHDLDVSSEGRRLMKQGKDAEAEAKLQQSWDLKRTVDTATNLGEVGGACVAP